MTSAWLVASGSTGTKWSSPRSEAPPALLPFSRIPTRLTSRPRMIGLLDAPGAKVEPVIPGLEHGRSRRAAQCPRDDFPRWEPPSPWRIDRSRSAARPVVARRPPAPAAVALRVRDCGLARSDIRAPASGNNSPSPHDRARRRHGDFWQLRRGWGRRVLGHRVATSHRA
jgi:hypothetical protein